MKQYHDLVRHVLRHGERKQNRTGVDTMSVFNYNYTIDLDDGFPLLTTKKVSFKNIVLELVWFLSGRNDVAWLEERGCAIWSPWKDVFGNAGQYGPEWRRRGKDGYDQIQFVIDEIKRNPNSRRLVVSAWNTETSRFNPIPPCHSTFVLNVGADKRINLSLLQRSGDVALGIPYNIASYALLMHLFARFTNLDPGIFAHTIVDAHIYTCKPDRSQAEFDHVPGLREQLTRKPQPLPLLEIADSIQSLQDVEALAALSGDDIMQRFNVHYYNPQPAISFKPAV